MAYIRIDALIAGEKKPERIASYLFAHSGGLVADLEEYPLKIAATPIDGRATVVFPAIAEVDLREFLTMVEAKAGE